VDRRVAGRGVIPTAVAMVVDHCFFTLGLHRIEVNIRPENAASLRVVDKLGIRSEGLRRRYLHIDGAWRDHASFAMTVEEVPSGLLARWRSLRADLAEERARTQSGLLADPGQPPRGRSPHPHGYARQRKSHP
jgi:[ribosomal protein S5]-alanine N-acetyltransferase